MAVPSVGEAVEQPALPCGAGGSENWNHDFGKLSVAPCLVYDSAIPLPDILPRKTNANLP